MNETIELFCHKCNACVGKDIYILGNGINDLQVNRERYPHSSEQCKAILKKKERYDA